MFSIDILIYLSQQYKFLLQLPSHLFYRGDSCLFWFPVGNINLWDRVKKLGVHRYWESRAISLLLFFFWFENIWELPNFCIWAENLLFSMFCGKPYKLNKHQSQHAVRRQYGLQKPSRSPFKQESWGHLPCKYCNNWTYCLQICRNTQIQWEVYTCEALIISHSLFTVSFCLS